MVEGTVLFVGRFQPFHRGHLHLLQRLRADFAHVFIGVGSSQVSHHPRNPFSFEERREMIQRTLRREGLAECTIVAIPDIGDDDRWVNHVRTLVPQFDAVASHDPLTRRLFERAGVPLVQPPLLEKARYSGTEVRRRLAEGRPWEELVPEPVAAVVREVDGVRRVQTSLADQGKHQERREGKSRDDEVESSG